MRKSRGLRLEDLADEGISPATISNIERGIAHVNSSKVYYLVQKLGLNMSEIPSILMEQEEELKDLKLTLDSIEAIISMGKYDEAMTKLEEIKIEDHHPYSAILHYIKGKCYAGMKKWNRAERSFSMAISLANQNRDQENIEAASFAELGLCCYRQNEIEKALEFTESGLDAFQESGGRGYVKYVLLRNKAVYLERLGRVNEGLRVIQEAWDQIDQIDESATVLNLYSARAELLRMAGQNEEAIKYAQEGLELSRRNKNYQCMFDMWTIMGSVYTSEVQWEKAERCFYTALASQGLLESEKALTDTYVWLGILYTEQKKWAKAKTYLEKAVTNAEAHNDAPKLTYALRIMGDYFKQQGKKDEAIPYYQKALKLARSYGYKKNQSQILFRLSQCYQETDRQEFEKCLLNMYEVQLETKNREADIFEEAE
ncbi:tetratricopeptide repeat protein [Salinithrix halophila]|uniref:Tetratricopeptide repeat protein n=1 Tax=Salinithrix halophila TaxID=1485204 RepID=A0ABV8JHP4_9BACL